MSAKTASGKLESELKQEMGNAQDLRKMLADERCVMSTMDVEHQQLLLELEQRHQEKVSLDVTPTPVPVSLFRDAYTNERFCSLCFSFYFYRSVTSLVRCSARLYVKSPTRQSRRRRRIQSKTSFSSASKFR